MFKVPHKMPVGAERSHMHPYEYNRRAGMALADARSHERDVMDVIQQQTRNPIGGQQMAQVAFNQRERQYVTRDMHLNNSNAPPQQPLSRDFDSRNVYRAFNEDAATRLVDGRGGGAGGYVKGQQRADGQGVHQHLRGAPPSSGSYDRGPPKLVPSCFSRRVLLSESASLGECFTRRVLHSESASPSESWTTDGRTARWQI